MSTSKFDPRDYPLSLEEPAVLGDAGAWIEHIPFAMCLVEMTRPGVFVELGTHWGDSYLAICQTVQRLGLGDKAKCYAVDTWKGDPQAGYYGDQVLAWVRQNAKPYEAFSTLLQMTFDEALGGGKFDAGSVDLLHIDGLHTYEAVKHDFETWLPKMSPRGVVFFHDTTVRLPGYGVHQLWAELAPKYPSWEFPFGNGLGVLAVGSEPPEALRRFIDVASGDREAVVKYFGRLGAGIKHRMMFETLARRAHTTQTLLDQWWRALGVQVAPGTEIGYLVGAPWTYGDRTVRELHQLANADIQARQELQKLKSGVK